MDGTELTKDKTLVLVHQRGVSLIELMIGMVIGLVLLGGILQTMLASKEASATRQSISTITDNARFLFSFMARDLRMGGRGYGGGDWPVANPNPIELIDDELIVRYLDVDNNLVEARYRYDDDEDQVEYRRLPANYEPLVGGIGSLAFNFACYVSDADYSYQTPPVGECGWEDVTAVRTSVTFTDEAPWAGQGIEDKAISSTVTLRNQVSRLIQP